VELTNSDDEEKEEIKKELENIDAQKIIIIENISKLKKELEILENKKTFLQPVNEVVFDNSLKDVEKEIVEEYNKMLNSFAYALQGSLK
jgi:predicted nuclease with TOPRIM domain